VQYALWHALDLQVIFESGRFFLPIEFHLVEFDLVLGRGGGKFGEFGRHAFVRYVGGAACLTPWRLETNDG